MNTHDIKQLKKLLHSLPPDCLLANLSVLTRKSAFDWDGLLKFTPLTVVFCDGVEFNIGSIPLENARELKNQLKNEIHGNVQHLTIKNMLIH
jgi:hypothetical protein